MNSSDSGVDKDELYGKFQHEEDARASHRRAEDALGLKLAHKALDIKQVSDDPMDIKTTTVNNSGMGFKEIAVLSAAAVAIAASFAMNSNPGIPVNVTPPPVVQPSEEMFLGLEFTEPK